MAYLHKKLAAASKTDAEGPNLVEREIHKQRAEKLKRKHSAEPETTHDQPKSSYTDQVRACNEPGTIEAKLPKLPKRKRTKHGNGNDKERPNLEADRVATEPPRRKKAKHRRANNNGHVAVETGKTVKKFKNGNGNGNGDMDAGVEEVVVAVPQGKKPKLDKSKTKPPKSKKEKPNKIDEKADLDSETSIDPAFGKMDNRLLADYVAQRIRRFNGDLSLVEFEDKHIPEKSFTDTSAFTKVRTLGNLPSFLEHFVVAPESLGNLPKTPGCPHTLVVTASGARATDLVRVLRNSRTNLTYGSIAKLFAKHIKLQVAVAHCRKTRMCIGVGTPVRIIDLLDAGALSLEKLERIVIDCSHFDEKKRSILDMKETLDPLVELLGRLELKGRYTISANKVDLLMY